MKKNLPAFFVFAIVATLLISSWFRDGFIYGGGDVGLQSYNPKRILENARYVWWDSTAPGSPIPQGLSAIPFQFILFLLQSIGFSPLLLQASLFFILLFLMGFGMFSFLKRKLVQVTGIYAVLGGLFYMLNPYMMVQVWHRFIHTTIILAATLPFLAIFWESWIKKGATRSLLFFLITSFLAVYIFGTFAFIVTVWTFLFFLTLSNMFPWKNRGDLFKLGGRFVFGLFVWILVNCWYLYPITQISPAVLSQQHKSSESIVTLVNISAQAILPYTLQLANPFYLFDHAELGPIYKNPLFQILPWFFVATILVGLINSFKIKSISIYGILFLISIFLVKGAAPPFGNLYLFGFNNIFALGILRNPFEKTGLILVFFATILLVVGLKTIFDNLKEKINSSISKITIILIMLSVVIFSWPMLSGKVIGKYDKPAYVAVPETYKQADKWLNQQRGAGVFDGKILHLPLTRGESVQYFWKYGYSGLEPSDTFFTSFPSISRGFNISRTDDSLTALSLIFYKPYNEDKLKILQLLQAFNVRFIVLHKDVNWLGGDIYNPIDTEKVLDSLEFIAEKAEFGDLIIYQVDDKFFGPKIELSDNVSLVYPQKANMRVWPWLVSGGNYLISPIDEYNMDDQIKANIKASLVFPENSFSYPEASDSGIENTVKTLDTELSAMQGTVQYLKQLGTIQVNTENTVKNIVLSSKKLVEIFQGKSVAEYSSLIDEIIPYFKDDSALFYDIAKSNVLDILKNHDVLLSYLEKRVNPAEKEQISRPKNKIREILKSENLLPIFPQLDRITETQQIEFFDFWVNTDNNYELILVDSKIKDAYSEKLEKINFQINDKLMILSGKDTGNSYSYGNIELKKGLNEISFSNPASVNLISTNNLTKIGSVNIEGDAISLTVSKNNPAAIESPVLQTAGEDVYQIEFTGEIPANFGLYIQVIQDTDNEENGQKVPRISFLQHLEQTNWQGNINVKLPALALQTREAKIRIIGLIPPEVSNLNVDSTLTLKNLKLIRVLKSGLVLRNANLKIKDLNNTAQTNTSESVTFKRVNSVQYEGKIKITKPEILFFKETYHSGWKLQLIKGDKVIEPKVHYLGNLYGNAWFIDQTGDYSFQITFEPQKSVYVGMALTALGIFSLFIYKLIFKKIQRK